MKRFFSLFAGFCLCAWANQGLAAAPVKVGLSDVIATVEKSFKPVGNGAAPISNFAANFFQRTTLAKGQEMRAEGQMTVRLPDERSPLMYRFEYFRPAAQEIVSNGNILWIYHPENREVILSDISFLNQRNNLGPNSDRSINFLYGLSRISKDFQIAFASGMYDSVGNYVLELTPRRAMLSTRRMLIVVDRDSVLAYVSGKTPLNASNSAPSPRTQGPSPQPRSPFGTQPTFGAVTLNSDPFPILSTTIYDQQGNSTTMELTNIQVNSHMPDNTFNFIVPGGVQIIRPSEQNLPH
ncbi:MAG TPA: outer membrane lipoprotein carrier protein LolA [Desulfuromonadaceae bacterium]|jgi:outer membrane lipoprotein-sorting protein